MKKYFQNTKKLTKTILIIFVVFFIFIIGIQFFKHKKISQKNLEIKKILIWSIKEFKNKNGKYPENLNQIEEYGIINDINILKNKNHILYQKTLENKSKLTSSGFILEILK